LLEQAARTLGLLGVTSAVGWLLTSDLVSGPLTVPLTSLDELRRWLDDSTPAIVPAALLRLAALGVCAYLALALVLTLVAQLVDRRTGGRAARAVRRLLPAALQRLVTGSAQCSIVAATAFPLAALPVLRAGDEPPGPTATMVKLDAEAPTATMTRLPAPAPTTTVTTIAPTTAPTSLAPVPPPPRAPAPAIPSDATATATATADETWTVTPGDTFWSIAEEALTDRRGSFPTQHEIVRYWRQLIATNQSRLAAPGNPDLLLPGQSLVLPPPSW
jgi:nucleoid-associated protein YgaU